MRWKKTKKSREFLGDQSDFDLNQKILGMKMLTKNEKKNLNNEISF